MVDETRSQTVTRLLGAWRGGDRAALDALTPIVYQELRRLASSYMKGERRGHSLQPTALIHEAYLRLVDGETPQFNGRSHFFGVAAQIMRQILIDFARSRTAQKRGGGGDSLPFVKGNFDWNGALASMGDPPPNPLGFNAFGQTCGTGAAVIAPVSLHMGQRSGRIPALPYPLPVRLPV